MIAAVLDSAVNSPSLTEKFGLAISRILPMFDFSNAVESLGALFVIFAAALLALTQTYQSYSRAMLTGLMIFSTFSMIAPSKNTNLTLNQEKNAQGAAEALLENRNNSQNHSVLAAATFKVDAWSIEVPYLDLVTDNLIEANATVQKLRPVSSCKPSLYGFFGLGSYFNNDVRWCHTGHVLAVGERVQLIQEKGKYVKWTTFGRGYIYIKLYYLLDGKVLEGWAMAGSETDGWNLIEPDALVPDTT